MAYSITISSVIIIIIIIISSSSSSSSSSRSSKSRRIGMIIGEMMSINIIMNINITSIRMSWGTITPKVFLKEV